MLRGKDATRDRQEIREKDAGDVREVVTPVEPEKPKRGDTIRIRLECSSTAHNPNPTGAQQMGLCSFKTKLYPERDRASAQKAFGKHAVDAHSLERKVKIVTKREEVEA